MTNHAPRTRAQLISELGLLHDPFKQRVTEQENSFNFGQLYVETQPELVQTLLSQKSVFLFADYGMGKTATSLALEYRVRSRPTIERLLTIRYRPTYAQIKKNSTAALEHAIYSSMAIDSIVQYIERHHSGRDEITSQIYQALQFHARLLPTSLRPSKLRAVVDEVHKWEATSQELRNQSQIPPDGVFWPPHISPIVKKIIPNQQWHRLMNILITTPRHPTTNITLEKSVAASRALGFETFFLAIDAIDHESADPQRWLPFLDTVLANAAYLREYNIHLKCFLPSALQPIFTDRYVSQLNSLTPMPATPTIHHIQSRDLERILRDRFLAYRKPTVYETGFEVLTTLNPQQSIESWLAEQAHGSPRRLMELTSALLDFHTTHGFQDNGRLHITADEWQQFTQNHVSSHPTSPP